MTRMFLIMFTALLFGMWQIASDKILKFILATTFMLVFLVTILQVAVATTPVDDIIKLLLCVVIIVIVAFGINMFEKKRKS